MQTAVEYIFEQLEEQGLIFLTTKTNEMTISISASDYLDIKRLAKEMEKQQSKNDYYAGLEGFIVYGGGFEQYYNETYGSKGSEETLKENHIVDTNEMVSSQTEISDEEIKKWAKEYTCKEYERLIFDYENYDTYDDFVNGAKKYREQLKLK